MTPVQRGVASVGLAWAITAIGAPGQAQAQAQAQTPPQPHFTTRTEIVRVDALVTNRGSSVAGLTGKDFELRDNGVVQQVEVMDASALPVDVSMALDTSSSLGEAGMLNLKRAATGVIDSLRPGDRAALVSFTDLIQIRALLTNDFDRVRTAIGAMDTSGRTALRDGAYVAILQTDPQAGGSLIVVFTDGEDNTSFLTEKALQDTARRANAVIYSVTLGPRIDAVRQQGTLLDTLPHLTGGRRLSAENPERLRELFGTILKEFRQRYILSYTPDGVDRTGFHTLDLRLTHGLKGEIRARHGYFREASGVSH
jgi:VWFA-related protein